MAKAKLTSITDPEAREFLANKDYGHAKELPCEKIAGFHLRKTIGVKGSVGTWRFRYTNASGKVRVITLKKFNVMGAIEAASLAFDYRHNVNQGIDPLAVIEERNEQQRKKDQTEAAKKFRTIGEYLETPYAIHQKDKIDDGVHTISIIRSAFKDLLKRDMDTISQDDVISWQVSMYKAGRAHSTVVRAYGALKTMLRHAVKRGYLTESPIAGVSLNDAPDKEQERVHSGDLVQRRRMLSSDELEGIQRGLDLYAESLRQQRRNSRKHGKSDLADLDAVTYPHWFIPFCHLAMHTGLRTGDIRTLTWQELNLPFKRLTKTPRKTRHHNDPMQVRQTLNPVILDIMKLWHEQNGRPTTGLVFPSPVTGRELDKKAHVKPWKHVLKLGQVHDLDFYSLRHHFISALVSHGVPLLTVAHLAGHKSTAMIERHYGHLAPDQAADVLATLGASLAGEGTKKGQAITELNH